VSSQRARPGRTTVLRDGASWIFGWLLIFKQAGILFPAPDTVSLPLVVMGGLIIGVPGLAQLVLWGLQIWAGQAGTAGPLSPGPSLGSPSPSPQSPEPSGADA